MEDLVQAHVVDRRAELPQRQPTPAIAPVADVRAAVAVALGACTFFLLAGLLFVPLLGIQGDEALFAQVIYQPRASHYDMIIGHHPIALMLMSYLGTLKSWVYAALFAVLVPTTYVVRVPMLLAGAASVWFFFLILRRIDGLRAAIIGCSLLAVDAGYLLTSVFDWGPVALQHLLIGAGTWLLIRFVQGSTRLSLVTGCVLLGLAVWDKALAVWMLSGLAVATAIVCHRRVVGLVTPRNLGIGLAGFVLGAAPLIAYNVHARGQTLSSNVAFDLASVPQKAHGLRVTATGSGLLGWINGSGQDVSSTRNFAFEDASVSLSELTGRQTDDLQGLAFVVAVLVAPLGGIRTVRIVLFGLIALLVAWIQMAASVNGGSGVHHIILLWPLPQLVVAAAFAGASRRIGHVGKYVLAAALVVMLTAGALVLNEHYRVIGQNGGSPTWSDAVYPLGDYLAAGRATGVFCTDWGILESLRLLHGGALPLASGMDPPAPAIRSEEDLTRLRAIVSDPNHVFVTRTAEMAVFPDVNRKWVAFAATIGLHPEPLQTVHDRHGRVTFEVYRFSGVH